LGENGLNLLTRPLLVKQRLMQDLELLDRGISQPGRQSVGDECIHGIIGERRVCHEAPVSRKSVTQPASRPVFEVVV